MITEDWHEMLSALNGCKKTSLNKSDTTEGMEHVRTPNQLLGNY
jgi:hypothetical protein